MKEQLHCEAHLLRCLAVEAAVWLRATVETLFEVLCIFTFCCLYLTLPEWDFCVIFGRPW